MEEQEVAEEHEAPPALEDPDEELRQSGSSADEAEISPSNSDDVTPVENTTAWQKLFTRRTLSLVLLVVDLVVFELTLANVHGPVRFVLGLVLGAVIPGWSVVGPFRLRHAALEMALSVAMSFVLLMIAAQVLITVHEWHLLVLEEAICVACLPSLIWQSWPGRS